MTYKFYINGIQVFPVNAGELSINRNRAQEGRGSYFDVKLGTSVKLDRADFEKFEAYDMDHPLEFVMTETSVLGTFDIYRGFSTKSKANELNKSFAIVELPMTTSGASGKFLANYDQTVNMMEVPDTVDYGYYNAPKIEFRVENYEALFASTPSPQPPLPGWGNALVKNTGGAPIAIYAIYARELVTTLDIAGEPVPPSSGDWELVTAGSVANNASTWARTPDILNPVDSSVVTFQFNFAAAGQPITPPPSPNGEDWELIDTRDHPSNGSTFTLWVDNTKLLGELIPINNGRRLMDVLQWATRKANPDMSVSSEFLTSEINYVTGLPNELKDLVLYSSADVKGVPVDIEDYVRDQDFVLRDFLEVLCNAINAEWWINDRTSQLIIEHVSYRPQTQAINLSEDVDQYPVLVFGQTEIPRREEFATGDRDIDFTGTPIEYLDEAATSKISVSMDNFIREVGRLPVSPSDYPDDSLCMVQLQSLQASDQFAEQGAITGDFRPNVTLSQANLMEKYGGYRRMFTYFRFNFEERSASRQPYVKIPTVYKQVEAYYDYALIRVADLPSFFTDQGIVTATTFTPSQGLLEIETTFTP